MSPEQPNHLRGLVDMGSNGIRFSITNRAPPTARSLPTVFQERLGISLYDAQNTSGQKGPIPQDVIDQIIAALKRFKTICADFGVSDEYIRVLATEATRTATNSEDYRRQLREATDLEVDMLLKEQEGRIGAFGVASSFEAIDGLVMDLGGGSTQLTWMISSNGQVETSPKGSFSFPYGAAALTQLLSGIESANHSKHARKELRSKMLSEFQGAFEHLDLPESLRLKARNRGLTLYLSGGGFRGWGYLLMSRSKIKPYPIPIINGFQVEVRDFGSVDDIMAWSDEHDGDLFRISKRRAAQVPAVAFLISVLIDALPFISDVRFCQGGVREGFFFDTLTPEIRSQSPLVACTSLYSLDSASSRHFADLLKTSLPADDEQIDRYVPAKMTSSSLLQALANTMFVQSTCIKESASTAALYLPITGVLSTAHGVSHNDRALLSLSLCHRWGAELPPPHENLQTRLQDLLTKQEAWWANYLGTIAGLIGIIYPAGRVPATMMVNNNDHETTIKNPRLGLKAKWANGLGKKGNLQGVILSITLRKDQGVIDPNNVQDLTTSIENLGKKKSRIGGKEYGFGVPVVCEIDWI